MENDLPMEPGPEESEKPSAESLIEKAMKLGDEPDPSKTIPANRIAGAMNSYEMRMVYQRCLVASIAAMIGEPQYSSKEHLVREADAYARLAAEAAAQYMKEQDVE